MLQTVSRETSNFMKWSSINEDYGDDDDDGDDDGDNDGGNDDGDLIHHWKLTCFN